MIECPNCNKFYDDDFDFCPYCGKEKPDIKICPKCELETFGEYIFCPRCGTELIEKSKSYEALKFFNEQIEINPSNDFFWSGKAYYLFESGRYMEAIECYDKTIELNPSNMLYKLQKETCILKIIK